VRAQGWFLIPFVLVACSEEQEALPELSVAESLGLDEHLGAAAITTVSEEGRETVFGFEGEDGPLCLRGDPFLVSTRQTDSEDLIVFLQGGGACWSEFCLAVTKASSWVPAVDILDTELAVNPLRDWNVVYLPYCDGSFFAGDNDIDEDGDGQVDRYHRGLQNLSAALDIAQMRFPAPRRVVLAGSSGGAYGTLLGTALVRHVYPEAELMVVADSGMGLGRPGDDAFVETILAEFNLSRFLPEDCPECLSEGHLTGLVGWYLERDPDVRVALFSSWYDSILGDIFLKIPPADFRDAVAGESGKLVQAHPDRVRRFLVDGRVHTTLLGDASGIIGSDLSAVEIPPELLMNLGAIELGGLDTTAIDDLSFATWLEAMVQSDDAVWVDVQQPASAPPD
jgi:hypothetical protein